MPKIVQYNLPPGGTVTQLADGQSAALEIEGSDGKDYLIINTVDGSEQMEIGSGSGTSDVCKVSIGANPGTVGEIFRVRQSYTADSLALIENTGAGDALHLASGTDSGSVKVLKVNNGSGEVFSIAADGSMAHSGTLVITDGTASGNIGQVQTNADALVIDSTNDTGMTICLNGNDPGRLSFVGVDNADVVGLRAVASNTTANSLTMLTNGADRIKIDSTGKVSVGASTPEHLFHVQDGDAAVVTNSADAVAKSLVFTKSRNATDGSATIVNDNDVLGRIDWYGADASSGDTADNKTIAASIYAQVDGTPGHEDMPGSIRMATTADDASTLSDRVVIRRNGNVGLGDTEPNYRVVIGGGLSTPILYAYNSNSSGLSNGITSIPNGAAGGIFDHRATDSIYLMNTTATNAADDRNSGIAFFGRKFVDGGDDEYPMMGALRVRHEGSAVDQKGYMAFYTNDGNDDRAPQERMRIASDGKIGINCNNSGYVLEARGTSTHSDVVAWSNTGGALGGRLETYDNEAGCVRVYGANKAGTANQSQHVLNARDGSNGEVSFNVNKHNCDFRYSSENETDMLFIDASAGKIGINESAPDALISTKGTLTTQLSGTVTATNGSTTIEGAGTDFKAELTWGSSIKILSEVFTVVSITDDDTLIIDSAYAGSTASSLAAFTDPPAFNFRTGDDKDLFKVIDNGNFHLGADDDTGLKLGNTVFPNDDNSQTENTGFGTKVGRYTTGNSNVLFGQSVMMNTGASDSNVCFGRMIMTSGSESDNNTIMGSAAGTPISGGNDNCLFGFQAGNSITSGDQNVSIGSGSDVTATNGNQIAIGYQAVTTAANQIMLGNHRNTDMTLDAPPITVKQTSTSGFGISLEHEGSSNVIAALGEDGDGGWLNLSKAGTTEVKLLCSGSSFVGNDTSRNFGVGLASPTSNFHSAGTNAYAITAGGSLITSSHTVGTHSTMLYNASGGDITATLPAASGVSGRVYTFKLVTKGGNDLIIASNGSETIDGSTSNYTVDTEKEAITIQSDGVGWQIIGKYLS